MGHYNRILIVKGYSMNEDGDIVIVCGHYGSGKTNLSLNLAVDIVKTSKNSHEKTEKKIALLDMDIVNPYFRSSEYGALMSQYGIKLIAPVFSGTTLDTPALPAEVYTIFAEKGMQTFIDVGGDDAGITALAAVKKQICAAGYRMIYVINRYRILSQSPDKAYALLRQIEAASGLRATAVVNNSHLGIETTFDTVRASLGFAQETAELCGLPLLYNTVADFAKGQPEKLPDNFRRIRRYVKFPWE